MTIEDITVGQLIEQLQKMPAASKVRVWLPGSTLHLSSVFSKSGMTMIEGDIVPGSMLDMNHDLDDCITILGG